MKQGTLNRSLVLGLLLVAAVCRFHGLNWDQQIAAHPDERYIIDVATGLSLWDRLNPFEASPEFSYGHLPLYLLVVVRSFAPNQDPLLLARGLSAAFDVGTVGLTYALGRRLSGERVGLLAGACLALTVAHVQQAHFYTADTLLAFFTVATVLSAVRFAQQGNQRDAWLMGATAGLAVGTKAAGALLVLPVAAVLWSRQWGRRRALAACGLALAVCFTIASPFALAHVTTFLRNLSTQSAIVSGRYDVPYTRQYQGTMPYLYPLLQQVRWGTGYVLGLSAAGGLIRTLLRAARGETSTSAWTLLAWTLPFLGFVGGLYAKFPRYLLPVLPICVVWAAELVISLADGHPRWLPVLCGALLGLLVLRCAVFATMYRQPHPWVAATEWFQREVKAGATIAVEAWDHPLPGDTAGYAMIELPVFDAETAQKWATMEAGLEQADYLVIASRRGYGSLGRWASRYPRTVAYYQRLFEGEMGYELVACFDRHPRLGPLVFADDPTAELPFSLPDECREESGLRLPIGRLDESLVVYDHPRVLVFKAEEDN